jgi:uncharacterized protein (DUF2336 family)
MAVPTSLIPELDRVHAHGSPERRAAMVERITTLFLQGASSFNDDHVRLFDEVLRRLIVDIPAQARTALSHRVAPVGNAPVAVIRQLANDEDIAVAGPVLQQSPRLAETDLVDVAERKSRAHLLAISVRSKITEAVTDVLLRRGDRHVMHAVAGNHAARLSDAGFHALVAGAPKDDLLAEKAALRPDIPPRLLRDLVLNATGAVQQRLFAARPQTQSEIRGVPAEDFSSVGAVDPPRDFSAAQRTIESLRQQNKLDEEALVGFARRGQLEETVAALALLCSVPIEVTDRLMAGDRLDPVLILGKSAGWGWPTVQAIILARPEGERTSGRALDEAYSHFERLSPTTAQRVMRFWQIRRPMTEDRERNRQAMPDVRPSSFVISSPSSGR